MKEYDALTYGEGIADVYDDLYPGCEDEVLDLLEELAAGGPVLELGIGTGRVALPLAQRGGLVRGIDASPAMVEKLRAKPGGDQVPVSMGSFAEITIDERFDLIFAVFNTFFSLLTQKEQVQCFESVADHLTDSGRFLIEVFVPDLARFEDHQAVRLVELSDETVRIDAAEHDILKQQVTSQHVSISRKGVRLHPVRLRYAWPAELDLMAELAGLELEARWESWQRQPLTKDSTKHISVYRRAS